LGARAALLAYLEGDLSLEDASQRYVGCFPKSAGMDLERIRKGWSGWSAARKGDMAEHIRAGIEGRQQPDDEDEDEEDAEV